MTLCQKGILAQYWIWPPGHVIIRVFHSEARCIFFLPFYAVFSWRMSLCAAYTKEVDISSKVLRVCIYNIFGTYFHRGFICCINPYLSVSHYLLKVGSASTLTQTVPKANYHFLHRIIYCPTSPKAFSFGAELPNSLSSLAEGVLSVIPLSSVLHLVESARDTLWCCCVFSADMDFILLWLTIICFISAQLDLSQKLLIHN